MGILSSAASVFSKIAFRFEFLFPQLIGFYVGRKLKEYKEKGLLEDYKVKSKRRGKYHYLFDMEMFLTMEKGGDILWLKKRRKDT
jgi:hypothetical protein